MLVVGTRGRNLKGVHSLLPGSVSKYCLQQSPIPVIVVRPSPKREKKKKKRRADPTRRSYNHILELSEKRGSRIFDTSSSTESSVSKLPDEEAAVAEALGLPASYSFGNSRTSLSDRSSVSHDDSDSASPAPYSLDAVVMKSPLHGSPASSEESVVDSEKTQRPGTPPPPPTDGSEPSSPTGDDSSDEAQPPKEAELAEPKEPQEPTEATKSTDENRASIPVIEVSNDNDNKNEPAKP